MKRERVIVFINLLVEGPPKKFRFSMQGIDFHLSEYQTGWDLETAQKIIETNDGYADGIVVSGAIREMKVGKTRVVNRKVVQLVRSAQKTRVYTGLELRNVFEKWTVRRLLKDWRKFFSGKKILSHVACASPVTEELAQAGGVLYAADPLTLIGVPLRIKGLPAIERFLKMNRPFIDLWNRLHSAKRTAHTSTKSLMVQKRLRQWVSECDVFVTYGSVVEAIGDFNVLSGKIVILDYLPEDLREKLVQAGVREVIEFMPQHSVLEPIRNKPLSVLSAIVDQKRVLEESDLSLDDYVCQWIEQLNITPNRVVSQEEPVRRAAFLIHALSERDLWRHPLLKNVHRAPSQIRGVFEKGLARVPVFHYGEVRGVESKKNGQKVICDIYAMLATPKELLAMDEETAYQAIGRGIEKASARGASIFGLGAYTKIVGDAGVTLARRASVPVTTGNSYSAATTLWAAREMVEKLGMISGERVGKKLKAKAMVVGATGSIGRVSALLVSLVFDEIVLVAPRPDKLLEVRQEILSISPQTKVRVVTNPNQETSDTDLIVTATSNRSGSTLDINQVKPGAVICDCSRPVDIGREDAQRRPDVLVIESGEVALPGNVEVTVDIGLPKPSVYACLAETVLLTLEGRWESFSLSRDLSWKKVREIYKLGIQHGARLSTIQGPLGVVTDEQIKECRRLAKQRLKTWGVRSQGLKRARSEERLEEKEPTAL